MHTALTRGAGVAALLAAATTLSAKSEELVIYHGWSSPAEVMALEVLKQDFESKGNTWIDLALPHDTGADIGLINLITGGNPPNVFMESNPGVYRDLEALGYGQSLTEFFASKDITGNFPEAVRQAITVDGEIKKIPVGVHIDGMVYYNLEVAQKSGVDPEAWGSMEEMFADFDRIRDAGFVPLAVGGQKWQIGYLTHTLAAALYGEALFPKLYDPQPDPAALDSEEMRGLLDWLRRWKMETDEGSPNRDWNVSTNMVISGQALMQIHGDWMKGEWRAAGKSAGVDFGCINIPGTKGLSVTVDAWGILGGVDEATLEAEFEFAETVVDPAVSAAFAAAKGSSPVRLDVNMDELDECSQNVIQAVSDPGLGFVTPHNTADSDWIDAIWNAMFNYWSDDGVAADQVIEDLKNEYDAIFG